MTTSGRSSTIMDPPLSGTAKDLYSASISSTSRTLHRKMRSNGSLPPKKRYIRSDIYNRMPRLNSHAGHDTQRLVNIVQSDTILITLGMNTIGARNRGADTRKDGSYTAVSHGISYKSSAIVRPQLKAANIINMRPHEKSCNDHFKLGSSTNLIPPNRASVNRLHLKQQVKEELVRSYLKTKIRVKCQSMSGVICKCCMIQKEKKKNHTLEVKDLNGNDMGIGYFSSMK